MTSRLLMMKRMMVEWKMWIKHYDLRGPSYESCHREEINYNKIIEYNLES